MSHNPHDNDNEPSTGRKVFGFTWSFLLSVVLTAIAIPLLFGAVCMPFNNAGPKGYFGTEWIRPDIVFGLYMVFALWGAIAIYRRTTNPGVKWGCMTALLAPPALSLLWSLTGWMVR